MYSNKTLLFIQIRDDQVQPTDHNNFRVGGVSKLSPKGQTLPLV